MQETNKSTMEQEKKDKRIGNEFWKLRSSHGRKRLFETSELMWEAACEYFKWCNDNPWTKTETTKKGKYTDVKTIPTERPYTITGLCLYLCCNSKYFNEFKKNLPKGELDFSEVITRIEETIYTQKFEGAAVGAFNANIIARDLGLTDKRETEHSGDINTAPKIDYSKLSDEAKKEIMEASGLKYAKD